MKSIILILLLTGCTSFRESYQFGDMTKIVLTASELHELNCKNHPNGKGCNIYEEPKKEEEQ